MNDRRRLALAVLASLALTPSRILAQRSERVFRIGILDATGRSDEAYYVAFRERLRELKLVEGRNLIVEHRSAAGRAEMLPKLGEELAQRRCDVLVAPGNEAVLAALEHASQATPIVVIAVDYDPQANGHVASLAHPGGRITGVSAIQSELPAKRLEFLREALPAATRVAVFSDSGSEGQLAVTRAAAKRLGVQLEVFEFKKAPYDYAGAFAEARRRKVHALFALGSANFVPARSRITRLSLENHLPSMFHHSVWVEAGGLISYGANFSDMFRTAAGYVSQLLDGKNAAELPIVQPTNLELVINAKTAKALGVIIPPVVLLRADRIIQ